MLQVFKKKRKGPQQQKYINLNADTFVMCEMQCINYGYEYEIN